MSEVAQAMMARWCWVVIVFGVVLIGAVSPLTAAPSRALFAIMGGDHSSMDAPLRFAVALMGAVTLGWGLTLLVVTSVLHRLDRPVACSLWRRLTAAVLVWYVVDSITSIATGFALYAVSNTVFVIAFALIVWWSQVLRSDSGSTIANPRSA